MRDADADLHLPQLDRADVSAMNTGLVRKYFLREAEVASSPADCCAKFFFDALHIGLAFRDVDDYSTEDRLQSIFLVHRRFSRKEGTDDQRSYHARGEEEG